ncbi:hypothetical protein ES708_29592 [subsurface metagenome]
MMLGGIKMPIVPPAATLPVANLGLYSNFLISGKDTDPIVAAVAVLEPLIAANIALPATVAMAKLPRKRPRILLRLR